MSTRPFLRRTAVTALSVAAALTLAVAPAQASVLYAHANGDLEVTSVNGADTVSLSCVAGQTQVNGADQLPCTDLETLEITMQAGHDGVGLSGMTEALFPQLSKIEVTTGPDDDVDEVDGSQLPDIVHADSSDVVHGNGGDDEIHGGAHVAGGDGNDLIYDTTGDVEGGSGNDVFINPVGGPVSGDSGRDVLDVDRSGAAARDDVVVIRNNYFSVHAPGDPAPRTAMSDVDLAVVASASGDDALDLRDGRTDYADCGDGSDSVLVDAADETVNCEHVIRIVTPSTRAISGPRRIKRHHRGVFRLAATPSATSFRYRVDHGAWRSTGHRLVLGATGLHRGSHTLQVAAVLHGATDPTPSTKQFRVTGGHR